MESSMESNNLMANDNQRWLNRIIKRIPKQVVAKIVLLMITIFGEGARIENFKFIYSALYQTILDSTAYGFETDLEMFNMLDDKLIKIRRGVLFRRKDYYNFENYFKNVQLEEDEDEKQNLILSILKSTPDISVKIQYQKKRPLHKQLKVLMGAVHNPSLFFLKDGRENYPLNNLMKEMLNCYEQESSRYCVEPELIQPGLIFVYPFKTPHNGIEWHRIRILNEIDQMSVEVFHVDFGLINIIAKTEIRFLKREFSKLGCDAFHCCLTGYNRISVIPSEVTAAFFEMTLKNSFNAVLDQVKFQKYKNDEYKVYHVTLFNTRPTALYPNMNDELTYMHLAPYKAAEKYKQREKAGDSDSSS